MSGLLGILNTAARAMDVVQRALEVSQNNVNNASTPGYVKQRLAVQALRSDPEHGIPGGVGAGPIESTRSEYVEAAVRERQRDAGYASQNAQQAAAVEPAFDVSGDAGIPGAINGLFQRLSALGAAPSDATARQAFFAQAGETARRFASAAMSLGAAAADAENGIRDTLGRIGELAGRVRDYNAAVRADASAANDAGLDANIHATLEELSGLADVTVLRQQDGSFTVLMQGESPLVVGDRSYEIGPDGAAGGKLGALVQFHDATLPQWKAQLDGLASALAGRVNTVVGARVFSWQQANPAASLEVDRTASLAGADPAALAASAHNDAQGFMDRYSALAADIGRTVDRAKQDSRVRQDLLNQARQTREEMCGVSLDEEAAYLLQFQRAYEAAAKLVTVIDDMTAETIAMIR